MPTATYSLLEKSGTAAIIGEWLPGVVLVVSIGVGRCSDLGATFFLNNKNVISLRNNAYMQYGLQYCNKVHYVNSG